MGEGQDGGEILIWNLAPVPETQMRSIIIAAAAIILLAATLAPVAVAAAYDGAPIVSATVETLAQQQRGEAELPWLFAVYVITWAAFFAYVFIMSRRQREMQREIDTLKRALDAKIDPEQ